MSIQTTREERRQLARDNKKWPAMLTDLPPSEWPVSVPLGVVRVLRSREFLVQVYSVPENGGVRLSVCRSRLEKGEWSGRITWDELQQVKREAGFGDRWAVEVYPSDKSIVNVANMRHIWLLDGPPAFAWNRDKK